MVCKQQSWYAPEGRSGRDCAAVRSGFASVDCYTRTMKRKCWSSERSSGTAAQGIEAGEAGPRFIWREELGHLVLGRPRVRIAGAQPSHQLEKREVASGYLVEPALPGQREHLHRPAADSPDRAQPT